MIEKFDSRVVV